MSVWRWFTGLFGNSHAETDRIVDAPSEPTRLPPLPSPPAPAPAPRRWPAALSEVREHPRGGIASARLAQSATIQGVPCMAGSYVLFHPHGRLASAVLARASLLEGESLAPGDAVGFDREGLLDTWSLTLTSAREVLVRSKDATAIELRVTLPAASRVVFEHRQVRSVALAGPLALDGVTFPAETELVFGDSGALSHARASEILVVRGVPFAAHEEVVFLFGRLHEGWLADDHEIDSVPCCAHEVVRFHENGRLARAFVSRDTWISGVVCREGTRVYLDEEGRLLEGTLAADCTLGGIPVAEGGVVLLDEGAPIALTPREDVEVGRLPLLGGAVVELTHDGRPLAFTLAKEHTIAALTAPRGSRVVLHESGAPKLVVMTDGSERGATCEGTWSFYLRPDGTLRHRLPTDVRSTSARLQLRESAVVDGLPSIERMSIELHLDLSVRSVVLSRDHLLGPLPLRRQTRLTLREGGSPAELTLASETMIDGVPCRAGTTQSSILDDLEHRFEEHVRLHPNGTLAFATLARDAQVDDVPLKGGTTIAKREDGSLLVGTLGRDHTVSSGLVAKEGSLFGRFADGSPSVITLAEPTPPGDPAHAAGSTLTFRSPGVLDRAEAHVPLTVEPLDEVG